MGRSDHRNGLFFLFSRKKENSCIFLNLWYNIQNYVTPKGRANKQEVKPNG